MKSGRKPTAIRERIEANVLITEAGCWEWQLTLTDHGYARMWVGSRTDGTRRFALVHRVAYETFVGPIPDGMHVDHLCRNPACVNPAHLEPVTPRENVVVRGVGANGPGDMSRRTHCPYDHPYDEANTYVNKGKRYCRTCAQERNRRYRERKMAT